MLKKYDRISIAKLQSSERIVMTACPVCSVGLSSHFAKIENFSFYQCDSCQSHYLDPAILASIDCGMDPRSFDEGYWKKERDKARLRAAGESLTRAGEAILYARRPVRRFLDVGAGGGDLLDELVWLFPEDEDLFHGISPEGWNSAIKAHDFPGHSWILKPDLSKIGLKPLRE